MCAHVLFDECMVMLSVSVWRSMIRESLSWRRDRFLWSAPVLRPPFGTRPCTRYGILLAQQLVVNNVCFTVLSNWHSHLHSRLCFTCLSAPLRPGQTLFTYSYPMSTTWSPVWATLPQSSMLMRSFSLREPPSWWVLSHFYPTQNYSVASSVSFCA